MLSIIIPTHKRFFKANQLLKSLSEQNFPKEKLEVLLISNLADRGLRERASYWSEIFFSFKYKELGLKGVNKARNMGIRFARGDILYFLDDDCFLPHPNHLKNLVEAHKNQPLALGIGGPYRSLDSSSLQESFYHHKTEQWIKECKGKPQLLGGNASYKRRIFDQGYFFDPSIVFGGSELSFNDSLQSEILIFDKDLWVYHHLNLRAFSLIKKAFKQGQGSFKRDFKDGNPMPLKKMWTFMPEDTSSFSSAFYHSSFKLGYFWKMSSKNKKGPQFFRFLFLVLKSRWYFLQYITAWLYGRLLRYFLGPMLKYCLGPLWYAVGWLYGRLLRYFLGPMLKYCLGPLWYAVGWLYGRLLRYFLSPMLKYCLGPLWYAVGWLYGRLLRYFLSPMLKYCLGPLWYAVGWFYGHVLLFLFHHSPPMKLYYFTRYQYYKRIKPLFKS